MDDAPNWESLKSEMGDNVIVVVPLDELRRDRAEMLTAAGRFDETKIRRYSKGTKRSGKVSGGRFAPKGAAPSGSGPSSEGKKQEEDAAKKKTDAAPGEEHEGARPGAVVTTVLDRQAYRRVLDKQNEPDQGDFEWPRPSPENAEELGLGDAKDTEALHTAEGGGFTPERLARHDEIIGKFLAQSGMVKQENPETLFMAGGSGSGKSTVLGKQRTDGSGEFEGGVLDSYPENAVYINPDDIKELLPEYNELVMRGDPSAASFVHEESSTIAKKLLETANARGYNVVVDGTGDSTPGKFLQKIEAAQMGGRSARVVLVDIPTDLAVNRAMERAKKSGRMVPEMEIRKVHKSVAQNFAQWQEIVDDWELWDNTADGPPVQAAKRKPVRSTTAAAPRYTWPMTAAMWEETKHPRHPAGTDEGGEFAPKDGGLPPGYTLRNRRPISPATAKRFNKMGWGPMLRDLWTGGGHAWQPWGSGHMSSGITNALTDRRMIDTAEGPGTLLYRITPEGLGALEDYWEWWRPSEELPDAPPGSPAYVPLRTPAEEAIFQERAALRAEQRAKQAARAAENAPRIAELQDELSAFELAEESRRRMIGTDDEPFIDQKLAEWQRARAEEVRRELRRLQL